MKIKLFFFLGTLFLNCSFSSDAQSHDKFLQAERLNGKVKSILEITYSFSEKFGQIEKDGLITKSISRYDIGQNPILYKSLKDKFGDADDDDHVTILEYDKEGVIVGLNKYLVLDRGDFSEPELSLSSVSKIKERSKTNLVFDVFKPNGELNSSVAYRLNPNGFVLERKTQYSGGKVVESIASKYDSLNRLLEFSGYSKKYYKDIKYSGFDMKDNPTDIKVYDKKGVQLSEYSYSYEYDSLDNWNKKTVYTKGKPLFISERSFTYFGSKNKRKTDWEQSGFKGKVKLSIESIYKGDYRFGKLEKGEHSENLNSFFDEEGELIQLNKKDLITINKYDIDGNIIESFIVGNKDEQDSKHFYKYDSSGKIVEEINLHSYSGDGDTTIFKYDEKGNLKEKIFHIDNPSSIQVRNELYTYNNNGFLTKKEKNYYQRNKTIIDYSYDANGNNIITFYTMLNEDGTLNWKSKDTSEYEYDSFGNWIRKIEVRSREGYIKERKIIYYTEKHTQKGFESSSKFPKEIDCNTYNSASFRETCLSKNYGL